MPIQEALHPLTGCATHQQQQGFLCSCARRRRTDTLEYSIHRSDGSTLCELQWLRRGTTGVEVSWRRTPFGSQQGRVCERRATDRFGSDVYVCLPRPQAPPSVLVVSHTNCAPGQGRHAYNYTCALTFASRPATRLCQPCLPCTHYMGVGRYTFHHRRHLRRWHRRNAAILPISTVLLALGALRICLRTHTHSLTVNRVQKRGACVDLPGRVKRSLLPIGGKAFASNRPNLGPTGSGDPVSTYVQLSCCTTVYNASSCVVY